MSKAQAAPVHLSDGSEVHPGNAKRMQEQVNAFALALTYAVRSDIVSALRKMAQQQEQQFPPEVLPAMTIVDIFDYYTQTDPEFINWVFPFCPTVLARETLGPIHAQLFSNIRQMLEQYAE